MCSVDIIVRAEHSKVPASRLVVDFCVKYNLCTKKLIYENKDKKSLEVCLILCIFSQVIVPYSLTLKFA